MLGKLVFGDMQVEAWIPGAEVMGELSQYILKAVTLGKICPCWPDCFDLFFSASEFLLFIRQLLGNDASVKPSLYQISYLDMLQPCLLAFKLNPAVWYLPCLRFPQLLFLLHLICIWHWLIYNICFLLSPSAFVGLLSQLLPPQFPFWSISLLHPLTV